MKRSKRRLFVGFSVAILTLTALNLIFQQQAISKSYKRNLVSGNTDEDKSRTILIPNGIDAKELFFRRNEEEREKIIEKCPKESPLLQGNLKVSFRDKRNYSGNWPPSFEEVAVNNLELELGGYYPGPRNCKARNSIAVIVPYRDREEHLRYFLHYIHLILQRQQTRYIIYVVEQDDDKTFNKGQLMNAAFLYITNNSALDIDCIFFHDVDTISEDDRTLYKCRGKEVAHLAMRIDRLNYTFCCGMTVGGVMGIAKQQFAAINGFSNSYYGWGAEDDDMDFRIRKIGNLTIYRPPEEYKRFKLVTHERDEKNQPNPRRMQVLYLWRSRQAHDGINSLNAPISKVIKYPTHTRLYVTVKPEDVNELANHFPIIGMDDNAYKLFQAAFTKRKSAFGIFLSALRH